MSKEKKELKSKSSSIFRFKQFEIDQNGCTMKVGTDGVLLGAWAGVKEVKDVLDIDYIKKHFVKQFHLEKKLKLF